MTDINKFFDEGTKFFEAGTRYFEMAMRQLHFPTSAATFLTPTQISSFASKAGFIGANLVTAIAVALAESSGNPNAYNPETAAGTPAGLGSYGLWQIYLNAHPEFTGENLFDPQTNANAAFSVFTAAGGFTPWTTFNNGAYLQFVPIAQMVERTIIWDSNGHPFYLLETVCMDADYWTYRNPVNNAIQSILQGFSGGFTMFGRYNPAHATFPSIRVVPTIVKSTVTGQYIITFEGHTFTDKNTATLLTWLKG